MLISYCCSSEKVCLHLFSLPCLQWMSSSFAYLTNVPSYECTITCWCFRWKERFSVLWKCPTYRVAIFVIFPEGLTPGLSWKIENCVLFVLFVLFVFVLNRPKSSVCWCFRWKESQSTTLTTWLHRLHWQHCLHHLTIDYTQPHWLHCVLP